MMVFLFLVFKLVMCFFKVFILGFMCFNGYFSVGFMCLFWSVDEYCNFNFLNMFLIYLVVYFVSGVGFFIFLVRFLDDLFFEKWSVFLIGGRLVFFLVNDFILVLYSGGMDVLFSFNLLIMFVNYLMVFFMVISWGLLIVVWFCFFSKFGGLLVLLSWL